MRKLRAFFVFAGFLAPLPALAIPEVITYHARVLGPGDVPVNGTLHLRYRFYQHKNPEDNETVLHEESLDLTAADGVFSAELGKSGFPSTLFDEPELWLGIKVGDDAESQPRLRVSTVPWARRAANAGHADTAAEATHTLDADHADAASDADHALEADHASDADTADTAAALTVGAVVPAGQVSGKVSAATTADTANALATSATVLGSQVNGQVASAADADTVGTKSVTQLDAMFSNEGHTHGAADIVSGTFDAARILDGTITAAKLAPGAASGAAFTPSGTLAATTVGGALGELDTEKAALTGLPLNPNYLKDTRWFQNLAVASGTTAAFETAANLTDARTPWGWAKWTSGETVNSATVKRYNAQTVLTTPSSYPELGNVATLRGLIGDQPPTYYAFAIAVFTVDFGYTGSENPHYIAYLRNGCTQFHGLYGAKIPTTTTALVKVIQLGTNQAVRIGSNGWPGQNIEATGDWTLANARADINGGCIDPLALYCKGGCSGVTKVAIALPYISAGHRTGFAWSGYSSWMNDDNQKNYNYCFQSNGGSFPLTNGQDWTDVNLSCNITTSGGDVKVSYCMGVDEGGGSYGGTYMRMKVDNDVTTYADRGYWMYNNPNDNMHANNCNEFIATGLAPGQHTVKMYTYLHPCPGSCTYSIRNSHILVEEMQ